jgi:gamma-glutamyltranspeptidase / glutathione hydrolase
MAKVCEILSNISISNLYSLGIVALIALGILENIQEQGIVKPLLEMEHNSVEYLHTLIEALRFVQSTVSSFI